MYTFWIILCAVVIVAVLFQQFFVPFNTKGIPYRMFLVTMVKNEELVIERMLQSVLPFAGKVLVCDTGSTDHTREIVQRVKTQHPTKEFVIVDQSPFVNFEHNRNLCIGQAKTMIKKEEDQYILLMDADQVFHMGDTALVPRHQVNLITNYDNGFQNQIQQLISTDVFASCSYQLWTHEILVCQHATDMGYFSGFSIDELPPPSKNWTAKHERDIEMLNSWIDKAANSTQLLARAYYHLAMAYESLNKTQLALETYQKHEEIETLTNYVFYSRYRQGICKYRLGAPDVEKAFLRAIDSFDGYFRYEPYMMLAQYAISKEQLSKALMYVTAGLNLPSVDHSRIPIFLEPKWPLYEQYAYLLFKFRRWEDSRRVYALIIDTMHSSEHLKGELKAVEEAIEKMKKK